MQIEWGDQTFFSGDDEIPHIKAVGAVLSIVAG